MDLNIKNEAHKSFETYLSLNTTQDKRFIGVFEKLDNGFYTVKDLRMSDFSRIEQYMESLTDFFLERYMPATFSEESYTALFVNGISLEKTTMLIGEQLYP